MSVQFVKGEAMFSNDRLLRVVHSLIPKGRIAILNILCIFTVSALEEDVVLHYLAACAFIGRDSPL